MGLLKGLNVKCLQSWLKKSTCWINYHQHHWCGHTTLREPVLWKVQAWKGTQYPGPGLQHHLLLSSNLAYCSGPGTNSSLSVLWDLSPLTTFHSVPLLVLLQVTHCDLWPSVCSLHLNSMSSWTSPQSSTLSTFLLYPVALPPIQLQITSRCSPWRQNITPDLAKACFGPHPDTSRETYSKLD